MEWADKGIVLSARPHGETSIILELLTAEHGRHNGLVRGGRSRRMRPVLQTGNLVRANWQARLEDQLGYFRIELEKPHASLVMEDRLALCAVNSIAVFSHLLAERESHRGLFEAILLILDHMLHSEFWPPLLVRWEIELLKELGFGLDLSACAATGQRHDLIYVSPKSGRAVSRQAGEPYKAKLLSLPVFLTTDKVEQVRPEELEKGFALTGYFLDKYILSPRNVPMPEARMRFLRYLKEREE